jgi:hypothetical protein
MFESDASASIYMGQYIILSPKVKQKKEIRPGRAPHAKISLKVFPILTILGE